MVFTDGFHCVHVLWEPQAVLLQIRLYEACISKFS